MIILIYLFLNVIQARNVKANRNLKAPQMTADYIIKCENIFTYYLEQESTITVDEGFMAEKTDLDHVSAADIQGISPDKPIVFDCPIMLKSGPIMTKSLRNEFGFLQTWTILHHDDFESRSSLVGWNVPHRVYCNLKKKLIGIDDSENDHFIEPSCKSNIQQLSKTFQTPIDHLHVRVSAELTLFGDWTGDSINVYVDDEVVWSKQFTGEQIGEVEHPCPNLMAIGVPIQFTCEHQGEFLVIKVQSNHARHPCDGSFGLDDVIVYYK